MTRHSSVRSWLIPTNMLQAVVAIVRSMFWLLCRQEMWVQHLQRHDSLYWAKSPGVQPTIVSQHMIRSTPFFDLKQPAGVGLLSEQSAKSFQPAIAMEWSVSSRPAQPTCVWDVFFANTCRSGLLCPSNWKGRASLFPWMVTSYE